MGTFSLLRQILLGVLDRLDPVIIGRLRVDEQITEQCSLEPAINSKYTDIFLYYTE